jgi:CheY-like chemotaxis protein
MFRQLRGISGIELQQKLAASGGGTPVIFITAHDEPEARESALAAGLGLLPENRLRRRSDRSDPPGGERTLP